MTMPAQHMETALKHVQRIVATASLPRPPITIREALEQITEELDLAGYGCLAPAVAHLEGEPRSFR
ncbi:MAG: hypothetical protein E7812_02775 [Phenylobacterium sp.]|nr:MAG: hypothetical protein E7812_02775 [Phenylobacterium sp.]